MAPSTQHSSILKLAQGHPELRNSPLCWESSHLCLVGCHFQDIDNTARDLDVDEQDRQSRNSSLGGQPRPTQDASTNPEPDSKLIQNVHRLATRSIPKARTLSFLKVLLHVETIFSETCDNPIFYYKRRPYHQPDYTLVYGQASSRHGATQPDVAAVGYFNYSANPFFQNRTATFRGQRFRPYSHMQWPHYPYFVCILLSIAQFKARFLRPSKPAFYTSYLAVTRQADSEFIYLFAAEIPSQLLDMLDMPALTVDIPKWVITRKSIPFEPYNTFRTRFMAELTPPPPPVPTPGDDTEHPTLQSVGSETSTSPTSGPNRVDQRGRKGRYDLRSRSRQRSRER